MPTAAEATDAAQGVIAKCQEAPPLLGTREIPHPDREFAETMRVAGLPSGGASVPIVGPVPLDGGFYGKCRTLCAAVRDWPVHGDFSALARLVVERPKERDGRNWAAVEREANAIQNAAYTRVAMGPVPASSGDAAGRHIEAGKPTGAGEAPARKGARILDRAHQER